MTPFKLQPNMTTPDGVFHPSGHILAMFPDQLEAWEAAYELQDRGFDAESISVIEPDELLGHIAGLRGAREEGDAQAVLRFAALASMGHGAVIARVPEGEAEGAQSSRAVEVLTRHEMSYGQRYGAKEARELM